MALDALQIFSTYLLNTYLFSSAVKLLNDHNDSVATSNMKDCMSQRFCNAVVCIAELVRVKKKLEIS